MRILLPKPLYSKLPYVIRKNFSQSEVMKWIILSVVTLTLLIFLQLWYVMHLSAPINHLYKPSGLTDDDDSIVKMQLRPPVAKPKTENVASNTQDDNPLRGKKAGKLLSAKIIGVAEENLKYYSPGSDGTFKCIKTGVRIPHKQVNDDYCDCPEDGSDEPSTGACTNYKFKCSTSDKSIPGSRINDNICDCCDGSDEWKFSDVAAHNPELTLLDPEVQKKLGKFISPCPNVCV